ncbi:uncharacterized protein [Coffea arabica]|uniref:ATP-dependent DNA helicase n=1 Tax=Coffea arabica TaxID=13443 RepID=A0ABM4X5B6_COFAR
MDRDAIRRKRYAEMPQSEKAALLRRRSEARAAKKRKESSRSFVRSVPLGYVETGDVLIREGLNYMTSSGAAVTNVSCPAPSSVVPIESNPFLIIPEVIQPCHENSALQHQAKADAAKSRKRHRNRSNLAATITPRRPKCSHPIRNRARVPGANGNSARTYLSRIDHIPDAPLLVPDAPDCQYCGAKRFNLESPTFYCSKGEISIVAPRMPYALIRLFIGNDEESKHFRKLACTYNNNLAFTAFVAKYDSELTKNTKGVYTFRVQGQVYHFLNGLSQSGDRSSGIQLYIFDTDEELKRRVASCDKLRESTLRLLMDILSENPYARFFKDLRYVPNINNFNIALSCYPSLDQRVYNLHSTSQVAAIWIESDDESLDKQAHILTLRLLKQFSIDGYVKIETSRLDFQRKRQNDIHTEILEEVLDSLSVGQTEGSKVGRKVILPTSFIGGPRDIRHQYLDAMALVQKYGKPYIFLTMTCNPMWKEIQDNLQFTEKPQDRPGLLSRVFRAKFEMLKSELLDKKIFGEVAACVYVIEFQKGGFPHAHLLLILKPQFKLLNPQSYDRIVSAELPNPHQYPNLYFLVLKHMIHGPCGVMDQTSPCMRNGSCKNHYPKNFCEQTVHVEDSYPCYRMRDNGKKIKVRRYQLDNRWVIPYCPYLLALFDCHMNVEVCSTLKLVKYLYKYVFKGHDLVSFKIVTRESSDDVDEIKEFQQGRWISPHEAFWRIYEFRLNEQFILFKFIFLKMNCFREAALNLGLLESDTYIEDTLEEAAVFQTPSSLRLLFATVLVHCSPTDPKLLWDKFEQRLCSDYQRSQELYHYSCAEIRNKVLKDISRFLEQMGKNIDDYHLVLDTFRGAYHEQLTKEIDSERNIEVLPEDLLLPFKLNAQQRHAYDLILHAISSSVGQSFFIDGLGGTGKTFLYRSLLATLRSQGHVAIAVATSSVAASVLPGGRTAHSRFKIPLDLSTNKTCQLSKQDSVARLLCESKLILWDEASMAIRETIEAFDHLLRDIIESELPFGGKVIVFGGDFRQTLPVIEQASKQTLIEASLPNSPLWNKFHMLKLTENMRAILDPTFSEFLLIVGEGREPVDAQGNNLTE